MWHLSSGNTDLPYICSVQFISVTQSCLTLCNLMACSMPGLPVHHQLQVYSSHVNWVGNAIQPSHPLSSPSTPALNLSQHQGLFKWVRYLHQVPKVLEFHTNYNCHKVVRSLLAYKKKLFGWWDIWAYLCLFGLDFPANSCFNLRAIFPFHLT